MYDSLTVSGHGAKGGPEVRNVVIALALIVALMLPWQASAQVRTEDLAVPLLDTSKQVTPSTELFSNVTDNSYELKSLLWKLDDTDAAFTGTIKVYQANHKDGPYKQWVSKVSGTSSPTITMVRKHNLSVITAPSSLKVKLGVNNGELVESVVNTLVALRRHSNEAASRLGGGEVETPVPVFPSGTVFGNGDPETLSEPIPSPVQLKSLDWNFGAASATTNVTLTAYVSNVKTGPYVRWTPGGTTTQFTLDDKQQGTDLANPDALWVKFGVKNDSGSDLTLTRMTALRRAPRQR